MRRSTAIVLGCLLLGTGVLGGLLIRGTRRAGPVDEGRDLLQEMAELRRAIDDVRHSVERGGGTKTVLIPAPPVAPSPNVCPPEAKPPVDEATRLEQQRNHPSWQSAETLVATAIDRGRWTQSDVLRFRELAREAQDIDMVPLMQRVDAAINARRLRPDPELMEFH